MVNIIKLIKLFICKREEMLSFNIILKIIGFADIVTQIKCSRLSKKFYNTLNINTKDTNFKTICAKKLNLFLLSKVCEMQITRQ